MLFALSRLQYKVWLSALACPVMNKATAAAATDLVIVFRRNIVNSFLVNEIVMGILGSLGAGHCCQQRLYICARILRLGNGSLTLCVFKNFPPRRYACNSPWLLHSKFVYSPL